HHQRQRSGGGPHLGGNHRELPAEGRQRGGTGGPAAVHGRGSDPAAGDVGVDRSKYHQHGGIAGLAAGWQAKACPTLILGGHLFDVVDDDEGHGRLARFQFQTQGLNGSEDGTARVGGGIGRVGGIRGGGGHGGSGRAGGIHQILHGDVERHGILTGQAGHVHDGVIRQRSQSFGHFGHGGPGDFQAHRLAVGRWGHLLGFPGAVGYHRSAL